MLEIRFGDGEQTVLVPLPGCTPEQAETKRDAVAQELEHAVEISAPLVSLHDIDPDLPEGIAVDPSRVVEVDLVDAL